MKIVRIIFMTLGLLGGILTAKAQAHLSIRDFYIMPGEEKTVTIDMTNSVEIRALQVLINLPRQLKMVGNPILVEKRQGEVKNESGRYVDANKTISYKIKEDGDCMIIVNANDAVPFSGSEGAIIALTLKAEENALDCSEKIELQDMELVYTDGYTYVRPFDYSCNVDICKIAMTINELQEKKKGLVDVYNLRGQMIRKNLLVTELQENLSNGIYVIDGGKVLINNNIK